MGKKKENLYDVLRKEFKKIPKEVREAILMMEQDPIKKEILYTTRNNCRLNPTYFDLFDALQGYLIKNKFGISAFDKAFDELKEEEHLLVANEEGCNTYVVSPMIAECIKTGAMIESALVKPLIKDYKKRPQDFPELPDEKTAKVFLRAAVFSALT